MRWLSRVPAERAQDSLEYLVVIGVLAVPLAAALIYGLSLLLPDVTAFICGSIDTAGPLNACF